jgi:hypothetical protein
VPLPTVEEVPIPKIATTTSGSVWPANREIRFLGFPTTREIRKGFWITQPADNAIYGGKMR